MHGHTCYQGWAYDTHTHMHTCTDAHTHPSSSSLLCWVILEHRQNKIACMYFLKPCYSSYTVHEVCYMLPSHVRAPWCCCSTDWPLSVVLRCGALLSAAAAAAAGGASIHSLQCCDVRPPYLSPGCSIFPHLIPFARPQRNTFIKRGDLRAGGRWNSLQCASLNWGELPVLVIWLKQLWACILCLLHVIFVAFSSIFPVWTSDGFSTREQPEKKRQACPVNNFGAK